jgi:D-alanine--D-alanine ligase
MRIAVVHTVGATCGCAAAVAEGLYALGHDVVFVDSAEIERRAAEISGRCDLVIDHTDTFRGTGLLRPFVRGLLEAHGARIVGSGAGACFRADGKVAAKACWSNAGIPVPPGVAVTSGKQELPGWLKAPVVLKPAFEHMSRGLQVAATSEEIHAGIAALLERFGQPVLVETFIPGRELAVSLLEEEGGLRMLPPLEWCVDSENGAVLTEAFKQLNVTDARQDVLPAGLPPDLAADLQALSTLAFRTLGLRDYARFDIRLSTGGTFYFLEANTTPSLEPLEALALSARWEGWDYPVLVEKMLSAALRRYGRSPLHQDENMQVMLPTGPVDLVIPAGVHRPPASTLELAVRLDVRKGERVLDLGCGAGLLAIAAARLGAGRVVATDIDPRALEATRQNALANGVADRIEIRAGAWYEALNGHSACDAGMFDVMVATPPQTPGHHAFGLRYGGPDGTGHLFKIVQGAADFLEPQSGRLWLLAISLANPPELLRVLHERFHQVCMVHETERFFTASEYEAIAPGLANHLLTLRSSGRSDFRDAGDGGYAFRNQFICARGVKVS